MKENLGPMRSALFIPGNRPERVDKAINTDADAIIIDLEDAVPLSEKEQTRSVVRDKVLQHSKEKKIFVRINSLGSKYFQNDLKEIIVPGLTGIMVPKIDNSSQIREVNKKLLEMENEKGLPAGSIIIIPLIESAAAVENIFAIVSERTDPERIFTVAFGAADFTLDMGISLTKTGEELFYPRARICVACRAAKVEPPLDTPFMIDLKNQEMLEDDIRRAKQLGFQGKLCIHPNQVPICNRLFSPTKEEVEYARKVIDAFHQAERSGIAAIQVDGKFIDYPVVEHSRRILKLADYVRD